jgi:hypothetical protein
VIRKNKKFIDPRYFMDEKMELNEARGGTLAQRFWSGGMGPSWARRQADAWHQQWIDEGLRFNPAGDENGPWYVSGPTGTIQRFWDDLAEKIKAFNEIAATGRQGQLNYDIGWNPKWAARQREMYGPDTRKMADADKMNQAIITFTETEPTGAA